MITVWLVLVMKRRLVFKQKHIGLQVDNERVTQPKSNHIGSAARFWNQKLFEGFPNGYQHGPEIGQHVNQQLIEQWLPTVSLWDALFIHF